MLIKKLKNEKIALEDVFFLSPKKYENSILSANDKPMIKVNEMRNDFEAKKGEPIFATIQGFKGIGVKIAVLVDCNKICGMNFID